jgi:hypothetical protein
MRYFLTTTLLVIGFLVGLTNCAGYVPGAKAYWDDKVKELCEKDGGVAVYERVPVSREEFKRLGGLVRAIPIPEESRAPSDYPYVRRVIDQKLNPWNPEVVRSETQVIRRSDGKVLGRSIQYWRRGGDVPAGIAHSTSLICPEQVDLTLQIFLVGEGQQ